MADLSDSVNWFEIDNSNNKASPNGWPEGMMPSGVNDSARADKGALKRFWDRINPVQTVAPAGGVWTFTTSNPAYPTSYVDGEVYTFKAGNNAVGGDQFQVNTLGAKPIWRRLQSGAFWAPVAAGDIATSLMPQLVYDSLLNSGSGAFVLLNPFVPVTGDGAGGIAVDGPITTTELRINPWTLHQTGGNFSFFHQPNGERAQLDPAGDLTVAGGLYGNYVHSTGNLQADNAVVTPYVHAGTAGILSDGNIGTPATITGLDIAATRNIFASSGTVTAINLTATNAVTAINLTATNAVATPYVHAGTAGILSDGNITGLNLTATQNIAAPNGTVTAINLTATNAVATPYVHAGTAGILSDGNIGTPATITGLDIAATRNIFASSGTVTAGTVAASFVHSTGNVQADNAYTGNAIVVSGNISTSGGDIKSYGGLFTRDGGGGNTFGFYQFGATNVINFAPNHYLEYNISNGQLLYAAFNGPFWFMRQSDAKCFNQLGPTGGNGAYFDISDRRIKENIEPSSSGLAAIVQLNPVSFNRVNIERREVGFIAQDVEAVLPDAVQMFDMSVGDETIPTLVLTDSVIVAALVNAVKELAGRIVQLEGR